VPLIVSSVLEQARELDRAFTEVRHPNKLSRNALGRIQRRLVAELVKVDRRAVSETLTIELPLASFEDGYELTDGESVPAPLDWTSIYNPVDLWRENAEEPDRCEIVPWTDRHRVQGRLCVYVRAGVLYLAGQEDDWVGVDRLVLTYTPTPLTVAMDDELVLPMSAEECLVRHMGAFYASRTKDEELTRPRNSYIADAQDAETLWLDEVRRRIPARVSKGREVWEHDVI